MKIDINLNENYLGMGQFFENRGEDPNFRRIDLETYQSDSLQNFFVIRVIACTLWKN